MMNSIRKNKKGQSTVEWALILAFVALTVQVATNRTGIAIERLFRVNADAIGVEQGRSAEGEVLSSTDDEGGIAASGRTARSAMAKAGTMMAQAN